MAKRNVSDTRNIVLVGHGGAGKTTFVDVALHAAGATNRVGSVNDGTSLSDYDPDERERKSSIESAIFNFEHEGKSFNLIDTPGYPDFCGAALSTIPAVETVVVVISAADGVRVNTRRMWAAAELAGAARVILISRIDADNVQFDRLLADIRESFGTQCVPVFLPVGLGADCKSVVNLLDADSAPEGVVGDFDALKDSLRESVIECNDALMERYFEGEDISADEVSETFKTAIVGAQVIPILCCATEKNIGVRETLAFLAACTPSPAEGLKRTATDGDGNAVELTPDPDGPLCCQVFKSVTDAHVGKLAFLRIHSGSLSGGATVGVPRIGKTVRLGHLNTVFGAEHREVESAIAGDIVCVAKVEELQLNDVLCDGKGALDMAPFDLPRPMISLAVEPKSRDDEQKIGAGLQKLADGDPTFEITRDAQSSELIIMGMSDLHLQVMLSKLEGRYGVSANTHEPAIPYHETITRKAEGQHRHKKQTGGRGQFGDVHLRLEPNERGGGFEFIDEIKGGVIPQQYMPAIEKGIKETLVKGILAHCPIVDVKAAVFFGSFHAVDSSEAAFKIAGSRAFRKTFEQAGPVLLEPVMKVDVTIPAERMGDVTANLTGHRGQIKGMDQAGRLQILTCEMPMAEVRHFSTELQSITGGEGTLAMEPSHYEVVPTHLAQQVMDQRKKAEEEED